MTVMASSSQFADLNKDRIVGLWLLLLVAMVVGQVMLGGITRLTESGLSIMEWRPIMGIIPPLTEAEWSRVFEIYRQTGEYKQVNLGIDLAAFKAIYWWEYIHRLWGRALSLAFLLPFVWFWIKGYLRQGWAPRLIAIFALGGIQGLMGWIMVVSGFSDRTDVSQYRLTAHLILAVLIFAALLWSALDLLQPNKATGRSGPWGWALVGLIVLQIAVGGFVAGLDAGLVYNTFPLMGGQLVPGEIWFQQPWWLNFFENQATVQFVHRLMAFIVGVAVVCYAVPPLIRAHSAMTGRYALLLVAVLLQIGLGIATLLLMVPVGLAVAHQVGAFILLGLMLYLQHGLMKVHR